MCAWASFFPKSANKAGIEVTEEELQRAVYDQVRRYPGQEQQIYEFFRKTPEAVNNLRAPIFEEKVVDHLLSNITVTDKKVTKEELMADDEADAKPGEAKKPAKKAAPKKAANKKSDDEA